MLSDLFPTAARPQRLSEHVYKTLSEVIVEGKLPPGERLREKQMAEALGVSRTPVREAFARLKQQNLLSSDANGAYYVAVWDRQTLWEAATLRAALESLAFSLAPQNLSPEDFAHLEEVIQQMAEMDANPAMDDYKRMALLDFQFHTYVWSRTGHELLEQALENIKPQAHYYMYLTRKARGPLNYAERHRILIEFLKQGDRSQVNEIMLDHILPSSEKTIAWWERRPEMAEDQEVTG